MHRAGPDRALEATLHGLTFRGGQVFAGETLVLDNARIITSTGTPNLAAAYSRASGFEGVPEVPDTKKIKVPIEYKTLQGAAREEVFYFTGGPTRIKAAWNQGHALLTEWVQRANRLAESPFEMEPFATGTGKIRHGIRNLIGIDPTLAVKSGAALPTLGRMAAKWGFVGTGVFLGYQTADWAAREAEILDNTPFAEGITAGIATVGVKGNLAAAQLADWIPGVRDFQEWQESVAPGSTSLTKLAALPAVGAFGGLSGAYLTTFYDRANITRQLMKADPALSYTQALGIADIRVAESAETFAAETFDTITREKLKGKKIPFIGKVGKAKRFSFMGAAVGAALALPFLPGALVPGQTAEELEKLYSGEEEVAVRKGRWWELGRSPWEGGRIEYYRPHWYPRMLQRSYEKSLGIEDRSPFKQWLLENFTYEMEREQYFERPYPITGAAFEDIPVIGPILSATLGRLIKPPKLMHAEEWLGGAGEFTDEAEVLRIQERAGRGVDPSRGDIPLGTPVSPTDIRQTLGEQAYRFTELAGLIGFTASSIKEAITGREEWWDQEERLQTARRMYGAERAYWDLSIGGGIGTTEFFRRLYPHRRRQIPEYNPIRNLMPEWMPGPGEKAPDFLHGDPFTKIAEGELRLPGPGFAARFPELEGVAPKDYPLIYQYKILADIAPYADRTKTLEAQVRALRAKGGLSTREKALFQRTLDQVKEQKQSRKNFYEYETLRGQIDMALPGRSGSLQSEDVLSAINQNLREQEPKKGILGTIFGGYWEGLVKAAQNPLEALTPLAPASKMMHMWTAIEDYERSKVYGPDIAFWQHPVENFILPFIRESLDLVGVTSVPDKLKQQRGIEEYFDILKYLKNKELADQSYELGAIQAAKAYEQAAKETLVGVDPYRRDYRSIFRALPRSERDYFNAFSSARSKEERERILELIPANERRIYQAQWELQYADELRNQIKQGVLPEHVIDSAQQELSRLYQARETEGFPVTEELLAQFQEERHRGERYGDWFRRVMIIQEAQKEVGLPGPNWVGWHPAVDLDDIKLKVVQNAGLDHHAFNLWESDVRAAAYKPYLDDAAEELLTLEAPAEDKTPTEIQIEVENMLGELGIAGQVTIYGLESDAEENQYKILLDVSEVRDEELKKLLQEMAA
jgi:hypothetical protein